MAITFCSRSFALESVSRRETAVQGQTTATSYRYMLFEQNCASKNSKNSLENVSL